MMYQRGGNNTQAIPSSLAQFNNNKKQTSPNFIESSKPFDYPAVRNFIHSTANQKNHI